MVKRVIPICFYSFSKYVPAHKVGSRLLVGRKPEMSPPLQSICMTRTDLKALTSAIILLPFNKSTASLIFSSQYQSYVLRKIFSHSLKQLFPQTLSSLSLNCFLQTNSYNSALHILLKCLSSLIPIRL